MKKNHFFRTRVSPALLFSVPWVFLPVNPASIGGKVGDCHPDKMLAQELISDPTALLQTTSFMDAGGLRGEPDTSGQGTSDVLVR